ncbi:GNAT family N-acetyltransferase [Symbioplanes lichenis]|uniref:GNAT family N-acetyltransferase n=1 Tax=Symbioplanes lichenis TaxID=1629072 RepID=UPI002738DCBC|nr:GNAT family N-acetyltransferase [Actinoplanes lichenis]
MRETVSYLEMTAPGQLVPAAVVPGLTLTPLSPESPLVVELQVRIGAPHGWPSARRTADQWTTWLAEHPDRRYWLLAFEGEPAGLLAYDLEADVVEIETFGLVPEFVGRGLGGHALTLGLEQAWQLAPDVHRVWLHTSSVDHPHALPNYHRRGLRTFRTEERERAS